jgi:hypothetical protein
MAAPGIHGAERLQSAIGLPRNRDIACERE